MLNSACMAVVKSSARYTMKFSGMLNGHTVLHCLHSKKHGPLLTLFLVGTMKNSGSRLRAPRPASSSLSLTPHVLSSIPEPKIARMVVNGRHCKLIHISLPS